MRSQYLCLTCEALQWVVTALLVTHEEAITVHEVGPSHVYRLENVDALFLHRLAGGATGLQHLLLLAARGQHRATQHADVRMALAEQGFRHAQEEVLGTGLGIFSSLVANDVGEHGLSVGHVFAVGQ